jgi:hypothetical protein
MKKLGFTLMAVALSLPLTFAATQAAQSTTPSTDQAQTGTTKPAKKTSKSAKKHHSKKKHSQPAANSAVPATK